MEFSRRSRLRMKTDWMKGGFSTESFLACFPNALPRAAICISEQMSKVVVCWMREKHVGDNEGVALWLECARLRCRRAAPLPVTIFRRMPQNTSFSAHACYQQGKNVPESCCCAIWFCHEPQQHIKIAVCDLCHREKCGCKPDGW